MGRKVRNRDAPAALNMLPKFDDVAISTYFEGVGEDPPSLHHAFSEVPLAR